MMFKNYFVIAFRHFWRNRLYAFINVFSLATGVSASMLLFMYLRSEWRFEHHQPEADRIHRVCIELKSETSVDRLALTNFMLLPALRAYFKQDIQNYVRILPIGKQTVETGNKKFNEEKIAFTDQSLFEIFDMPFIAGDRQTALRDTLTAVVTEDIASKYFGSPALAVGKELKFPLKRYKIRGVIKNPVQETHLRYEIYVSAPSINKMFLEQSKTDITWLTTFNYVLLNKNTTQAQFQKRLLAEYDKYVSQSYQGRQVPKAFIKFLLQPIKDIHLDSSYEGDYAPVTNPMHLYILSFIGGFILLMACINYMNLATARAGQRAREVGLRKVLGASRRQLLGQFLGESFVLAFLSIWLGLAFAELLLPNFNYLTEKNFTQLPWFEVEFWGVVIFIILLISLLTGLYPAVYLSSFPPTWILQNKAQRGWHLGRMWLNPANVRKGLVILQFALSIGLMVGTLVAYSQWDYMRNQPLGFDRANIAVIDIPIGDTVLLHNLPAIRAKLHQNPQVIGTTVCTTVMDGRMPKYEHLVKVGERWGVEPFNVLIVDEHYIPLLNIKLKEGKNFLPAHPDSIQTSVIINETLARKMGWKNPIGKLIGNGFLTKAKYAQGDTVLCEVIGVVEDFHYQSLQHKIEPLAMYCMPKNPGYLMAKMKPQEVEKTQDWLRNTWQRLDSKHPVDAFSLEKHIISRYEPQGKLVAIFGYFSLLAIAISGLGLLGLTSYLTEQRTKEIGIRRVLGASAGEVVRFFALEFVWLVVVSFLLASPVVYVLMLRWLKDFAYHATPSLAHFLIAGLSSLTLALVTVSWLTWKVAKRKPSIALRYGG